MKPERGLHDVGDFTDLQAKCRIREWLDHRVMGEAPEGTGALRGTWLVRVFFDECSKFLACPSTSERLISTGPRLVLAANDGGLCTLRTRVLDE